MIISQHVPKTLVVLAGSVFVCVSLFLTSLIPQAQALSCIESGTPVEETENNQYVFYGEVTEVVIDEGDEGVGGDETGTITFAVEEWFKGDMGETVTLQLGSYSMWYSEPVVGQKAVVYTSLYEGETELSMPLCGRSTIGDGAAREVALLRGEEPPVEEPVEEIYGCHSLVSGNRVPSGYGAPFVPGGDTLLLSAECSSFGRVTLLAQTDGLIYEKGYIEVNGRWQEFTFNGEASEHDGWFGSAALYEVPEGLVASGQSVNFLALTCQQTDDGYQCGCQDEACAEAAWQIQEVQGVPITTPPIPIEEDQSGGTQLEEGSDDDEMIACTMDAMQCPDGSYVGRTGPMCEFVCPAQ